MKYFVLLNEFTLLQTLVLVLMGKPVYLIPSQPVFAPLSGLFRRIKTWMENRPGVNSVFDIMPEARKYWDILFYHYRTDIFARTEPRINDRFGFADLERRIGGYAMPVKHATCKYMSENFNLVFLLKDISDTFEPHEATLVHSHDDMLFAYQAFFGDTPRTPRVGARQFRPLVNAVTVMLVFGYLLAWLPRILRWRKHGPEPVFLGADFTGGEPQVRMVRDIVGDPGQCLFVYRNRAQREASSADMAGFRQCLNREGCVALSELPAFLGFLTGDAFRLYRHLKNLAPSHFLSIIKMLQKKASYRALLNRFHFQYFWCRDDYNPEHILRSQELRKAGSVSLGINHGLTSPLLIHPSLRYIDYDIYYVFGEHLHQTYYTDTWSGDMTVKPVGSLCMTREYLRRINDPRPKDIIYFVTPGVNEKLMHEAAISIARYFPEKKVYVKIKPAEKSRGSYTEFLDFCGNAPENFIETEENSYDLMFKAGYAVSGRSTVTAEAIQFGVNVLSFDFAGPEYPYYYRDFPGLCVKTAEEAIERISAMESGKETYPRRQFNGLIDLSGSFIIDVIRGDLGLPPMEPANEDAPLEKISVG